MRELKFVDTRLTCPVCKDEESNLHHSDVNIFNREENAEKGTHVRVQGSKVTINDELTGNPSKRRNGITMKIWCEQCDAESIFAIVQHKGLTMMGWEK